MQNNKNLIVIKGYMKDSQAYSHYHANLNISKFKRKSRELFKNLILKEIIKMLFRAFSQYYLLLILLLKFK